jgi:UDP-N-acetylmuramate dehydrogenase
VEVHICLQPGDADTIKAKMDELAAKRREKQPLEYPSAGSTFKRPEGYFAGALIEKNGFKHPLKAVFCYIQCAFSVISYFP